MIAVVVGSRDDVVSRLAGLGARHVTGILRGQKPTEFVEAVLRHAAVAGSALRIDWIRFRFGVGRHEETPWLRASESAQHVVLGICKIAFFVSASRFFALTREGSLVSVSASWAG